jgi:IS30 family transposase
LPRKTDLNEFTDEEIRDIAMSINITRGKCLGFKFPAEAFLNELGKDMTIRFNAIVALRS